VGASVDAGDHARCDVLHVAVEGGLGGRWHRRGGGGEEGEPAGQRKHLVLLRLPPEQPLQLPARCGVGGGEGGCLGGVIGQVVQLPGVVVGVVGAGGEPGQGGRCPVPGDAVEFGACPPPVFVDRPVAQRLEVLHRVTLGGARVVEGVVEAGAVHGFLFG